MGSGALGTLTNSGTITADGNAVQSIGSIAGFDNGGILATTGEAAVYNDLHGTVATLTNTGVISGPNGRGIDSSGSIGTFDNAGIGAISGVTAIKNGGVIDALTNSGQITGTSSGIYNYSFSAGVHLISALTNNTGGYISSITNGGFAGTAVIGGGTPTALTNSGTIGAINNYGTIASSSGVLDSGTIGTLTNSGVISGTINYGIDNSSGTINTLSNLTIGTISGDLTGIYSNGMIVAFTNAGTITAANYAIFNTASGSIGTLSNGGVITSTGGEGVANVSGAIATLTNVAGGTIAGTGTGLIMQTHGDGSGIYNSGSISALTNGGEISSLFDAAIYNDTGGSIAMLLNQASGTISGNKFGIANFGGFIGTLANLGTISAATENAVVNVDGDIKILSNSGLINGAEAGVYAGYAGSIGTITNLAGGTIYGAYSGVGNNGVLTLLSNSGSIGGEYTAAVANFDTIVQMSNSGTIAGGQFAVGNSGLINDFTNFGSGFVSGSGYGLANSGTIVTLNNQAGATIAGNGMSAIVGSNPGNGSGVLNEGSITALTNGGVITSLHDAGVYNGTLSNIDALDNQAGGTISGQSYGVANNGGTIATLTNNGFINAAFGIGNGGTIGTLVNTGTVTAIETGLASFGIEDYVENDGLIAGDLGMYSYDFAGTIVNNGTIAGVGIGIADGGTLISLVNNGDISGTIGVFFVDGTSTIGAVSNGGSISGVSTGFSNTSSVGSLSNSGAITGGRYGFDNGQFMASPAGSITALTNSGNISGGATGIYNGGTIGTISNSGTISGGVTGIYSGTVTSAGTPVVVSSAVISQITNTGTIYGATGIYLTGGGTNIFNGGTIASTDGGNAVFFGGADSLTLTTGSVIIGTIAGSGAAGQIVLEGDGSLDNVISNFGAGSALAVTPGADWTGTGSWTIAQVRNDGVFQAGRLGTPLNVTGDYLQNADGTLRVLVTTTENTELNITGTATLAGTVSYVLAPGHYVPHVYPYITATTVVGGFTTVNYGDIPTGLASTQYLGDPTVDLVITGSFFIPNVAPEDDTIFSAQTQALAETADADTASLLGKAVSGGAAASPACAAEAPLAPGYTSANSVTQSGRLASTLASAFCGAGGWVEATGSLDEADSSGGAASYNANTAGFLAGVDKIINAIGTRLGFAVGYDQTYLSDKSGGGGSMGTTRVALYGSQPLGAFTLAGVFAYGNANNSTSRNSGIGDLSENNSESIWSGGFQVSTDLSMHGISLMPAAGVRVASVGGGAHFAESATGIASAYAVSGKTSQYNSVQPYVLVNAAKNFVLASGITVRPNITAGYEYEAGTHGVATTLTSADGTVFFTPHTDLDPSDVLLSGGISAGKGNWSLFATYTARLASNWNTQTAEAGLRILF
jgi:hypothetical protein